MTGRVNSIQSLAAVDGPGVRFAVFMQGCHLRCKYCHNPDTWDMAGGTEYTAEEIAQRCERYREYFGDEGGITLSGGEPLLQADFVAEVFRLCHEKGINTCLDTSGAVLLTDSVKTALAYADRVLLDVKFVTDEMYRDNVGCAIDNTLEFLRYLEDNSIPTTLRQVIVPGYNADDESIKAFAEIAKSHKCADTVELLPFRKLCRVKYEKLGINFPFEDVPEPSSELMSELQSVLDSIIK